MIARPPQPANGLSQAGRAAMSDAIVMQPGERPPRRRPACERRTLRVLVGMVRAGYVELVADTHVRCVLTREGEALLRGLQ